MKSHLSPQMGLLAKPQAQVRSLKTTHFQRHGGDVKGVCRDIRWTARGDRGEPVLTPQKLGAWLQPWLSPMM